MELLCSSCASMGFSPGGPVCSLSPNTYRFLTVSKLVIGLDTSVKGLILCVSPLMDWQPVQATQAVSMVPTFGGFRHDCYRG